MGWRVLIVEDDHVIGSAIEKMLWQAGANTLWARTGEEAFFLAKTETVDIVILDLGLPGRSGLEVLKTLRSQGYDALILILSALSGPTDRIAGLRAGADDYLSKPFSIGELEARLEALLRRKMVVSASITVLDLSVDVQRRVAIRQGVELGLTTLEFQILEYLARHAGQVRSRDSISAAIWRNVERVTPLDNVIDVHVGRIRRKLDQPGQRKLLHTVRGVGYVLSERDH